MTQHQNNANSILTRDPESVDAAVKTLTEAFATDPVVHYMLNSLSDEERKSYMPTLFTAFLNACTLNNGTIYSIGTNESHSACVTFLPPGSDMANPWTWYSSGMLSVIWKLGFGGIKRILKGYAAAADAAKGRHMVMDGPEKEKYYYVFIIGAKDEARGQGLGSKLMSEVRDKCKREGMSCWLESTTEGSKRLYERLGWKTVEEIVLGKGEVGPDGLVKEGGEGVKIWGMLYRPEKEETAPAVEPVEATPEVVVAAN